MTFLKSISVKSEPETIISEVYYRTLSYKSLKLTWYLCSFSRNLKIPFANNSVEIFHCLYPEFTSFSSPIFIGRWIPFAVYYKVFIFLPGWDKRKNIRNFYTSGYEMWFLSFWQLFSLSIPEMRSWFLFCNYSSFLSVRSGSFLSVFWSCSDVLKNLAMNFSHIHRGKKMVFSHQVPIALDFRVMLKAVHN